MIKISENNEFLILQRKWGHPGCMTGKDTISAAREKRSELRNQNEAEKENKHINFDVVEHSRNIETIY